MTPLTLRFDGPAQPLYVEKRIKVGNLRRKGVHPGWAFRPGAFVVREKLKRLVYRSESLIDHNDVVALDAIFRVSQANNKRDRVTGALALPDGKFVQVIEGADATMDALMVRIRADNRHEKVVVLGEWSVTARLFPGWAMARPDPTPLSQQAFNIVTEDGSGVQVTSVLLGMVHTPETVWW